MGVICRYDFHYLRIDPSGYVDVAIHDLEDEREVLLNVAIEARNAYNFSQYE